MIEELKETKNKWQIGDIIRIDYNEDMDMDIPYYCPWGMHPLQHVDGFFSYISRYMYPLIPLGGNEGKTPLVKKWSGDQYKFSENDLKKFLKPEAYKKSPITGFGVLTGERSGFSVVDVDEPTDLDWAISEFGDTPYQIQTPRGGYHLFYSYNGENCHRGVCGRKIDIRANGGFIVIRNSYNPSLGILYEQFKGRDSDLKNLPVMKGYREIISSAQKPREEQQIRLPTEMVEQAIQRSNTGRIEPLGTIISTGSRNDHIFYWLKDYQLENKSDFETLLAYAYEINDGMMDPPLPQTEVCSTTKSVFRYYEEGTLYGQGERFIKMSYSLFKRLTSRPAECVLLEYVASYWGWGYDQEFPICYSGISKALGWHRTTVKSVTHSLVDQGYLIPVGQKRSKGGKPINTFRLNVDELNKINLL